MCLLADRVFPLRGFHASRHWPARQERSTYEWDRSPLSGHPSRIGFGSRRCAESIGGRDASGALLNFYSGYDGKSWHTGIAVFAGRRFMAEEREDVFAGSRHMGRRLYRCERIVAVSARPVLCTGIRALVCRGSDSSVGSKKTRTTGTGSAGRGAVGMSAAWPIRTSSDRRLLLHVLSWSGSRATAEARCCAIQRWRHLGEVSRESDPGAWSAPACSMTRVWASRPCGRSTDGTGCCTPRAIAKNTGVWASRDRGTA